MIRTTPAAERNKVIRSEISKRVDDIKPTIPGYVDAMLLDGQVDSIEYIQGFMKAFAEEKFREGVKLGMYLERWT